MNLKEFYPCVAAIVDVLDLEEVCIADFSTTKDEDWSGFVQYENVRSWVDVVPISGGWEIRLLVNQLSKDKPDIPFIYRFYKKDLVISHDGETIEIEGDALTTIIDGIIQTKLDEYRDKIFSNKGFNL